MRKLINKVRILTRVPKKISTPRFFFLLFFCVSAEIQLPVLKLDESPRRPFLKCRQQAIPDLGAVLFRRSLLLAGLPRHMQRDRHVTAHTANGNRPLLEITLPAQQQPLLAALGWKRLTNLQN